MITVTAGMSIASSVIFRRLFVSMYRRTNASR
jgi:hypothetical protein